MGASFIWVQSPPYALLMTYGKPDMVLLASFIARLFALLGHMTLCPGMRLKSRDKENSAHRGHNSFPVTFVQRPI